MQNNPSLLLPLGTFAPPRGLSTRILLCVEAEKRRLARLHLGLFGILTLGSSAALVTLMRYLGEEFSRSGFSAYSSLLFSDAGAVFPYWKEFLFSLAESLPIIDVTLFLVIIFVFLGSLHVALKNMRTALFATQRLRYG